MIIQRATMHRDRFIKVVHSRQEFSLYSILSIARGIPFGSLMVNRCLCRNGIEEKRVFEIERPIEWWIRVRFQLRHYGKWSNRFMAFWHPSNDNRSYRNRIKWMMNYQWWIKQKIELEWNAQIEFQRNDFNGEFSQSQEIFMEMHAMHDTVNDEWVRNERCSETSLLNQPELTRLRWLLRFWMTSLLHFDELCTSLRQRLFFRRAPPRLLLVDGMGLFTAHTW